MVPKSRVAVKAASRSFFTHQKGVHRRKTDYLHARKVINGMDSAKEIADQATTYQGVLEKHSGDYTDAMIKSQTKNLPSAHQGSLSPASLTDSMLDPHRMTSGAAKFDRADKLLGSSLGSFAPTAPLAAGATAPKVTNLKTHAVP